VNIDCGNAARDHRHNFACLSAAKVLIAYVAQNVYRGEKEPADWQVGMVVYADTEDDAALSTRDSGFQTQALLVRVEFG
jgi:hypothetical protein